MGWVTDHAPTRAELSSCVQCGLCLPVCPTYRLTGDEGASPRGRLTAMAAVASGIAEVDGTFEEMMGFCLQCRACEVACPSLVPFARAMEGARAEIAAQLSGPGRVVRRGLLGRHGLGSRRAVRVATAAARIGQRLGAGRWLPQRIGRGLRGIRPLSSRPARWEGRSWPAIGEETGTAALLVGCVMGAWFSPVHEATVAVLRKAGYRVVAPAGQTCCGALAAHDGAAGEAEALAARNAAAFAGFDRVVTDSAGCGAYMKDVSLPGAADVTEVVAEAIAAGRLPTVDPTGRRVAVQDPCHLRHAQRIVDQPRAILRAAGLEPVEIDPAGMCCGAAGVYTVLQPDTSAELGRRKAAQVEASGALLVASANPGCEMQLRSQLGKAYRVAHPVELYAEALGLV